MRTLSMTAVLLAITAITPARALAASTATGLRLQRIIHADLADVALRSPEGVACDNHGAVVVADTGNARLLSFKWKDGGVGGGTQVKLDQLTYPVRVQIDSKGFVLALDRRTRRIVRVDAKGGFAGAVELQGSSTPMTVAAFKLDAADRIHVLDVVASKVLVLSPDGRPIRELPLPKGAMGITDVAVDSGGRVYVVDAITAVVFAAAADAKEFKALSSSLKEMISFPTYLTADNRGKLYVVDQNGHAVVRLGVDGSFQGRELAMGAVDGSVYYPAQICINSDGDVFLADRANNRVQIFQTSR